MYLKYKNKGIGKNLLNEAKKLAKEKGATNLELMVWAFNDNAIEFYKKMGIKNKSYALEEKL